MWVLLKKNKKIKQTNIGKRKREPRERERGGEEKYFFLFFSSITSLFDIWKSDRQNSSGKEEKCYCETPKNPDFLRKGKMVILVKIHNFSRSRMTKRTSPLESSRKI